MKKLFALFIVLVITLSTLTVPHAEARGRKGSKRIGGYNSHGKGSHYIGGY